ncbi:hypothetical protein JCGZ_05662 [Jatropha curcas]|uniref:Uncharacterized protein n=1 Tax=Jatropha curcas TaxID=180498 RepID=A0A067LHX5_JATCU|nr:hypothetical protein JCGZ_05662 [Jatropha curcas]
MSQRSQAEQQQLWEEQSQQEAQQVLWEELLKAYIRYQLQLLEQELGLQHPHATVQLWEEPFEAYIHYQLQLLEQELGLQQPQATVDCSQFMSFLTPDKSFLTPWTWNTTVEEESDNEEEEQRIILQSGSFFSHDVILQVPYVEPKESSDQLAIPSTDI